MPDGDRFGAELRRLCNGKQVRNVAVVTKSVEASADFWTLTGVASTPRVDRMGDVVEPLGAKFTLPVKLLLNHASGQVVGNVVKANATRKGIEFTAQIPKVKEEGVVRDRITEAVHSLQYGLIDSTSIGFNPDMDQVELLRDAEGDVTGLRFLAWEWLELSLVPIPANPDATITSFKSINDQLRSSRSKTQTVPGRVTSSSSSARFPAGASASIPEPKEAKGRKMKTLEEQLAEIRQNRETKAKRMEELFGLRTKEARPFTEEERTEFDGLKAEIADIDDEIALREVQVAQSRTAVPVDAKGSRAPYGYVKRADPDDKFKGQAGTRMILCKARASLLAREGVYLRPSEIAEQLYGKTHPTLVAVMKANEVAGGGSGSGEWGAELVQADARYTGDFIDFLYAQTVFDRLPLREVPANVVIKGQDGAFTGYWVGQSKAIPNSKGDFSSTSTTPLKVAALCVMSNELIRDSSPAAEMLARDGLSEAHRQRIDTTFLGTAAAVSGVSPAGILNGVSAGVSSGNTAGAVRTDFKALLAGFIAAKNVSGLQTVTTPTLAAALGLLVNALGNPDFPGLTVNGGTFLGYPLVTGDNVGAGDFILLKPSDIWKIGDLGVRVTLSQDAMIEQSSAPTGETDTPTAASQAFTSMFQEESTAIKLVRPINFGKRRSDAVAYIGDADYGTGVS